jgi:uncharacterized protein (TIGR02284 family)
VTKSKSICLSQLTSATPSLPADSCRDAEEGFRSAANAVKDANLKTIFEQYLAQRARFAENCGAVGKAGGTVADSPGALGKVHAGWIALACALTGHREHQILEETERGEDLSLKRYREALQHQELPSEVRSALGGRGSA